MKAILLPALFIAILLHGSIAADPQSEHGNPPKNTRRIDNYGTGSIGYTQHFIFFSVLEGLYEDGISKKDVDQILMRKDEQGYYYHFIYACPVCEATIWALEAYHARPDRFYHRKMPSDATFGPGLSDPTHTQLYSEDPKERLGAINSLMQSWIERRMAATNLSPEQRKSMLEALEKERKKGMQMLESWRGNDLITGKNKPFYAQAYFDSNIGECAVCNGAVGKPMKLPDKTPDNETRKNQ